MKARTAVDWCKSASTSNMKWLYLYVPYHVFQQSAPETLKVFWTRIRAAWPYKDGKGFTSSYPSIPLKGRRSQSSPNPLMQFANDLPLV